MVLTEPQKSDPPPVESLECPRSVRIEIDYLLLAIEALDYEAMDAILDCFRQLELETIIPSRVSLWRLRNTNPLRKTYQRGSFTVTLEANSPDTHRLTVKPKEQEPVQVILNTVQLFDLMDSLDRLCTDELTLPDLKLDLQAPVQFSRAGEFSWSALLAGVALVSITSISLYFVPPPTQPR